MLPGVVNHDDARLKTVLDDGLCVSEDILLVLVVRHLHPGIPLRSGKEKLVRKLAVSREEPGARLAECAAQRGVLGAACEELALAVVLEGDLAALELK